MIARSDSQEMVRPAFEWTRPSDLRLGLENVRAIEDALPAYPGDAIAECFKHEQVPCDEEIPSSFSKYFAVMAALAGGNLKGKSLLDIGTGLGVFVAQATCLGMRAVGTDIFIEYEGRCREGALCILSAYGHHPDQAARALIHHDITSGATEEEYDFVTSLGMLEHIFGEEARRRAVHNMVRSLAPGGTLLLTCGPNQYFPLDFFHYGPRFVFYHSLPVRIRRLYLRLFAKPPQNLDPTWLNGMRVSEIRTHILEVAPDASVFQAFPLWVSLAGHPALRNRAIRFAAVGLAKLLASLNVEPVITLIARKPAAGATPAGMM